MITVKIADAEFKNLKNYLRTLVTKNHKRSMMRAAAEGLNRIQKRTSLGLDLQEQPFRPYSEAYKGFRKSKGKGTDKVKLIFTGRMRKSMQYGMRGQDGIINFDSRREAEKAAMNTPKRPFFGLNRGDERAVREAYFKGLKI